MEKALEVKNLSVSYRGTDAVCNLSLTVEKGEFVNIVGPNGAGKTTLIRAVLGLLPIKNGEIQLLGDRLKKTRNLVGYVPQNSKVDRNFPITVHETVETSFLEKPLNPFFPHREDNHETSCELLKQLGLEHLAMRQISELSGGEFGRLLIARALARKPEILILDEPCANIDPLSSEKIYSILEEWHRNGTTVIMVSHDLPYVLNCGHRTVCINRTVTFDGIADNRIIEKL